MAFADVAFVIVAVNMIVVAPSVSIVLVLSGMWTSTVVMVTNDVVLVLSGIANVALIPVAVGMIVHAISESIVLVLSGMWATTVVMVTVIFLVFVHLKSNFFWFDEEISSPFDYIESTSLSSFRSIRETIQLLISFCTQFMMQNVFFSSIILIIGESAVLFGTTFPFLETANLDSTDSVILSPPKVGTSSRTSSKK